MNDISIKLFDYIDNDSKENKSKLLSLIKTFKDDLKNKEDDMITAKEVFNATINNKRIQQEEIYRLYHFERMQLYNEWRKSKSYKDLLNLVNYLPPEFEYIPDIFTHNYKHFPISAATTAEDDYEQEGGDDDYKQEGGDDDYEQEGGDDDYEQEGGDDDYKQEGGDDDYKQEGGDESERDEDEEESEQEEDESEQEEEELSENEV
jgi:hypothetical protein